MVHSHTEMYPGGYVGEPGWGGPAVHGDGVGGAQGAGRPADGGGGAGCLVEFNTATAIDASAAQAVRTSTVWAPDG